MKRIKNYLFNKYVDYKLKQLQKVRFVAMNNYFGHYNETGEKTYGRCNMLESVRFSMYKTYGKDWEFNLRINGIKVTEDANKVYVNVMTHRPGKLIGKMGTNINSLANTLSTVFLKDTEIKIEETEELYGLVCKEEY